MSVGALWEGGSGGGREVILVLIIKKGGKSPKVPRSTHGAAAHGGVGGEGYRHVISQTAGQIQAPEPAAPPQVAQPPPHIWRTCHLFWDASNKRSLLVATCRKPGAAAEPHRLHSISDSCNLIELLIMIFA